MKNNLTDTTASTLSAILLRSLVDEIRTLEKPWHATPEAIQEEVIERLRDSVLQASARAVQQIAAGGFTAFSGTLEQLTVKDDGIKAALKLPVVLHNLDALVDDVGLSVLLVLAKPEEYNLAIDEIKADPDQPELPIDAEGEPETEAPEL